MDKPTIKIFISSPSDVLYERQIAKRIIAKLGKEFSASVKLEALLWEDMPLQATASFQEGIDQIINTNIVDIAVFILWSRLGTPLSKQYVKSDGSPYKSGTEYEFEIMYAASQQSGTPSILAYIKNAPIADTLFQSSHGVDFDFEEIGRQHKEAQRFIREKFYDAETKTVYGAYHQFEAPTTFEQKLTEHLRRLIIQKIGHEAAQIEWEGNPYVGLRSFRYDENAIFYGRRHTINTVEEKLTRWLPDKVPCLFVLGESGSGKSSLVRAGLLPDMIEFGWVENTKWKWFDLMPSQFRGNIYNGLLSKLAEAYPVLHEKSIGKDLLEGKEVNFGHLADILPNKADSAVLFYIDQFEEVFTDPLITEEERNRTFTLLQGMASTHKIWLIFSMRNDFYHKFTAYPLLSNLKNESIVYDLPKILHSELQEIVEEPAKKAGLKWEIDKQGIALNRVIVNDINSGVDDLPLIEFALSELYNLRDENNMLTYKAYEEIGKIDGAVIKYVNNFYNTLPEKEKELFYQILSALIAPSVDNKNLYVRKTALLKDLQKTEQHRQLINSLIDSHLLISGKDDNGEATVTIVHEILISSWTVIQDWIKQEKYFIDANNHYENLSNYWIEHNKSKNDLLQSSAAIQESEYFLYSWENNSSKQVKDFLFTSVKSKKRIFLPFIIFLLLIDVAVGFIWGIGYIGNHFGGKESVSNEIIKDIVEYSSLSATKILILNIIHYLMITVLLVYVVWKKVKALPNYRTINVSLWVWSIVFLLSVAVILITKNEDEGSGVSRLLLVFIVPNLIGKIIQKRAILKWKQRIFKRSFNIFYIFWDNSSKSLQKILRSFVWTISVSLVLILCVAVPYFIHLQKDYEKLEDSQATIYELFERLQNLSPNLSSSDRLFINQKRLAYLRKNFEREGNVFTGVEFGRWVSRRDYSEYAFTQYHLGHPEDFQDGIKDYIKSDSSSARTYQYFPQTTIRAAFELGLNEDCKKLLDLYKKILSNAKGRLKNEIEIETETIWTAEKIGLFDWAKEMLNQLELNEEDGVSAIYQAHVLLMTGETEKALSLYRRQASLNRKNEIRQDFAVFRWLGFSDAEISRIEAALNLDRINIYTSPADDSNTALAQPFIGKWLCEENGHRIQWEIKDHHNLCRYLFQTKGKGKNEWLDDDLSVTRYRFKQQNGKTIIEEYNVRTNIISATEITPISPTEIQVSTIENGNPASPPEIRHYKR